jgi:hypothetical protein
VISAKINRRTSARRVLTDIFGKKCAGVSVRTQRADPPAGILCHFHEKYRNQHKIQKRNACLKTAN